MEKHWWEAPEYRFYWKNLRKMQKHQTRQAIAMYYSRMVALEYENACKDNLIRYLCNCLDHIQHGPMQEQHKQESQRTRSRQREELFAEGWKTAHLFREKKEVEEEEEEVEEEEEEEEEEEVEENEKYEFEMKGSVFGIKEPNEGEFKNLMEFFKHSRNYREERQKNSEEELIPEVAKAAAMDARREEECTELFGPHAPKIMGMEASLQSFFNQLCDETGAKAWPVVPINI